MFMLKLAHKRRLAGLAAVLGAAVLIASAPLVSQETMSLRDVYQLGAMDFAIPQAALQSKAFLENGNEKIDGGLRELLRDRNSKSLSELTETAKALDIRMVDNDVPVTLLAEDDGQVNALASRVRQAGGDVTATLQNAVYARLPLDQVESVGETRGLFFMSRQEYLRPAFQAAAAARPVSEGLDAVKVALLHQRGITGKGVRVGIIDFGYQKYSALERNGSLPAPAATRSFKPNGQMEVDTLHGTACAEIVHAMAPDAQLYLAAISGDTDEIIRAAQWLVSEKVQIISFSGGGHFWAHNGRSEVDVLIKQIAAQGILWVNANGNEGDSHWAGTAVDANHDGWIDIGPNSNFLALRARGRAVSLLVNWDDWDPDPLRPTPTQDIDAYLFSFNPQTRQTQLVARSVEVQQGRGRPIERIVGGVQPGSIFLLALRATRVTRPVKVHVYASAGEELYPQVAAGSVGVPATSADAIAIGAVDVRTSRLEPFSSQGPTDDGRMKPDAAAPDNNRSLAYEGESAEGRFPGTSAACPHTSGLAALIRQLMPHGSYPEFRKAVLTAVRPMGSPTPNNQFGRGHIDASRAPATGRREPESGPAPRTEDDPGTPPGQIDLPGSWGGNVATRVFERILASPGSASGLRAQVAVAKDVYFIGDGMKIGFRADRDCQCVLLHRDIRGKYTVIADDLKVKADRRYSLPQGSTTIRVTGPAGVERVLLLCSERAVDLNDLRDDDGIAVSTATYEVKP